MCSFPLFEANSTTLCLIYGESLCPAMESQEQALWLRATRYTDYANRIESENQPQEGGVVIGFHSLCLILFTLWRPPLI